MQKAQEQQQVYPAYRSELAGLILAGGRSQRMGTDKCFVSLGKPALLMIERSLALLEPHCSELIVVSNEAQRIRDLNLPYSFKLIEDEEAYLGPLAGIASGAQLLERPWCLVRAVDMPWLHPNFIGLLMSLKGSKLQLEDESFGIPDYLLPESTRGIEPLCALYRSASLKQEAADLLALGRRRVCALEERLATYRIPAQLIAEHDPREDSFLNLNFADQLLDLIDFDSQEALPSVALSERMQQRLERRHSNG